MKNKLWTKDYTMLTIGATISYMGNSTMSFVLSLLVLDIFDSLLLYSAYLILYKISKLLVPSLIGPYIENKKKSNIISICDLCSSIVYIGYFFALKSTTYSTIIIFIGAIFLGAIDSIHRVAYKALIPSIVSKEQLSKSYSVTSFLDNASSFMMLVASILYEYVGTRIIFLIGAILFFLSALIESVIKEEKSKLNNSDSIKKYVTELKEGFSYVYNNKALYLICIFYFIHYIQIGTMDTLWLPYYKSLDEYGYYLYFIVGGANLSGSSLASFFMYKFKINEKWRYKIAIVCCAFVALAIGTTLAIPWYIGMCLMYISGICTEINNNIYESSTYTTLDESQRARYSGIYTTCTNLGTLVGTLFAGLLSEYLGVKNTNLLFGIIAFISIKIIFLGKYKKEIKKLFNLEGVDYEL